MQLKFFGVTRATQADGSEVRLDKGNWLQWSGPGWVLRQTGLDGCLLFFGLSSQIILIPFLFFFFLFFLWLDRAGKERRASLDALSQRKVPDAHVTLQMG